MHDEQIVAHTEKSRRGMVFGALVLTLFLAGCGNRVRLSSTADQISIETRYATYTIGKDGKNRSFVSKTDEKDYLNSSDPTDFMYAYAGGQRYPSSEVLLDKDVLSVGFGNSGIEASFKVTPSDEWITLELVDVKGKVDSIRICNLSIALYETFGAVINACYNPDFAVSVQAIDYNVISVPQDSAGNLLFEFFFMGLSHQFTPYPGKSRVLTATVEQKTGLRGARLAIVTCPGRTLLKTLEKLELAFSLPHPTMDGVWGKISPEAEKSYIFCSYSTSTIDQVIQYAIDGGFRSILASFPRSRGSHLEVDLDRFPGGLEEIKACVDKIHAAGLKAGIHLLSAGIQFDDPYVTPIPDKRLVKEHVFTLATDIDEKATVLPIIEEPSGLRDRYSYEYYRPGLHLQIGDEIVRYDFYSAEPPYGFTQCRRGALGTAASKHKKGDTVYHLGERYNHFVVDVETSLLGEVAQRITNIVNTCGFDMMYLDGAEFTDAQGSRYYLNKFVDSLYRNFNREVLVQASIFDNYAWHYTSRMTSNDAARGGIRKFLETLRLDNIKLYKDNFVPADFGWYGLFTNSEHCYSTLPEEIEYGCAKSIAYDEAFGLQTNLASLARNGRTKEILGIIKNYEDLRLKGYFPQAVKDKLKEAGSDYQLSKDEKGSWFFRKIDYLPDVLVESLAGGENVWTHVNRFGEQPLAARIRAVHVPAPYSDPGNVTLIEGPDLARISSESSEGLKSVIGLSREFKKEGTYSIKIETRNDRPAKSGWAGHINYYSTPRDLGGNRMMGAWVHGDGSGALLNFHLETPGRRPKDFYVDLNFKGWKYVVVSRFEGDRVMDYVWPYVWKFTLMPIQWSKVDRSAIYVNAAPGNSTVTCYVSPLKAIRMLENEIENPSLNVNGRRITFPGRLRQDEYVEFGGDGKCRFYDAFNNLKAEVDPIGEVPRISAGENRITFECGASSPDRGRAVINIISAGPPL